MRLPVLLLFLLLLFAELAVFGSSLENRFFPHNDQNSNVMTGLDQSRTMFVSPGFPIFGRMYRRIGICSHGFITLGLTWCSYVPNLSNVQSNIISAFWSDLDYRSSNAGNVSYSSHLYTDTDATSLKLFKETESFIKAYGAINGFQPTIILVVTWKKANPYPYTTYASTNEFVSFQLMMVTDGRETYIAFIYQDGKMLWKKGRYDPHIGYSISGNKNTMILGSTGNYNTFRFDTVVGNTGQKGKWIWKMGIDRRAECIKWYNIQPNNDFIETIRHHSETICPCSLRQMRFDTRYRYWYGHKDAHCYRQRGMWYFHDSHISFFTVCCYHPLKEYLYYELNPKLGLMTLTYITQTYHSSQLWYRYYRSLARAKASSDDSEAFNNCCIQNSLCHLYAQKRPIPDCVTRDYNPPVIGWSGGDPHIKTLDGYTYTFNGIGDYNLLSLKNSSDFMVHCRMSKALLKKGNDTATESNATVFSAFALSAFQGALVEIYMNVTTGSTKVLVNKEYYNVTFFNQTQTLNGTDITWKSGNRTQLSIVYESGVGAIINIFETLLTIQITSLPSFYNSTSGLFGVYNNDISDDLTRPDGTVLSINSSQKTIYYQFGKLWEVNGNQSLFTIDDADYDASYTPMFFDNIDDLFGNNTALKEKAISLCGKTSFTCLFDIMLTGDTKAAAESKSTLEEFNIEKNILVTYPPKIVSPKNIVVTFGKTHRFRIIATSKTSSNLTYSLETTGINAKIDTKNGSFSLYVNSTYFTLKFLVKDENNLAAVFVPNIRLCYCLNGSTCNTSAENPLASSPNFYLSYAKCNCTIGFKGPFCQDKENDYCKVNPCFPGVNCTNNNVTSTADCGPCPNGYFGDGRTCQVTYPPKIISPKNIVVTFGKKHSFRIIATSNTSSNLTYSLETTGINAKIDTKNGSFSLYVNSTYFTLKFLVKDENNLAAVFVPNIRLCYCLNSSTCNTSVENPLASSPNFYLTYATCNCSIGFEGPFCQYKENDYCKVNPCFPGVNCTNNNVTSTADCGPCPNGYFGDGKTCQVTTSVPPTTLVSSSNSSTKHWTTSSPTTKSTKKTIAGTTTKTAAKTTTKTTAKTTTKTIAKTTTRTTAKTTTEARLSTTAVPKRAKHENGADAVKFGAIGGSIFVVLIIAIIVAVVCYRQKKIGKGKLNDKLNKESRRKNDNGLNLVPNEQCFSLEEKNQITQASKSSRFEIGFIGPGCDATKEESVG